MITWVNCENHESITDWLVSHTSLARGQGSYSWPLTDPSLQTALGGNNTFHRLEMLPDWLIALIIWRIWSDSLFSVSAPPCSRPSPAIIIWLFITSPWKRDPAPSVITAHADSSSHMHGFLHLTPSRGLFYCNRFNIPQMSRLIYTHTTVDGMIYSFALIDFLGRRVWLV